MTPSNRGGRRSSPAALTTALLFGASGTFLAAAGPVWFSVVSWVIALVAFTVAIRQGLRSPTPGPSSISRFRPHRPTNRRDLARALDRANPRRFARVIARWARIVGATAGTRPYRSVLGVSVTVGLVLALTSPDIAIVVGMGAGVVGLRDARVGWTVPLRAAVVLLLVSALGSGVRRVGGLSDTAATASFLAATLAVVSAGIERLQRPGRGSVVHELPVHEAGR